MFEVFAIVAPVFLIVGFGYAASYFGLFTDAQVDSLLRFITYFAVTCLLFRASATLDIGASLRPSLLASYYLPGFACFAIGIILARKLFGQRPGESVAAGFTTLFGNSLFLGLPIVERAYGEAAMPAAFAVVSVHAATMYTLGVVTMEANARDGAGAVAAMGKVARSLSHNPLVIAVVLGFGWNVVGLPIPTEVDDALTLMSASALPAGMFAVGAALTRYSFGANAAQASLMVVLKLLVYPALAMLCTFTVFGLTETDAKAVTLMAAVPGGLNIYLFAALYQRNMQLAANVMLLGTVLSIATLPIWLIVLG